MHCVPFEATGTSDQACSIVSERGAAFAKPTINKTSEISLSILKEQIKVLFSKKIWLENKCCILENENKAFL